MPTSRVDGLLAELGLRRGRRPVPLPVALLLVPDDPPPALTELRQDVVTAIRRRVRHHRRVAALELAGLALSWLGVFLPGGRVLTVVGVAVVAGGALLGLTGKDRLAAVDATLAAGLRSLSGTLAETLAIALQVGPYSYAGTGASGLTADDVLRQRAAAAPADIAAALADRGGRPPATPPAETWSRLLAGLDALARLDAAGRTARHRARAGLDRAQGALLLALVVAAALGLSSQLPAAAFAAAASLVVVTGRLLGEEPAPLPAGPDAGSGLAARSGALSRAACTVADLRALVSSQVLVVRGFRTPHRDTGPAG